MAFLNSYIQDWNSFTSLRNINDMKNSLRERFIKNFKFSRPYCRIRPAESANHSARTIWEGHFAACYILTTSHLTLRWIVGQKGDFNSFIPATITTVLGANPVQVVRRWIAKDIRSLSSQSECAFNAIHWLWLIDNWPTPNISGFIGQWVTAPHRHREGMGSNPVEVLNFSGFSMQLLKLHS